VGLFLATECARRGLAHRIVETNATQSTHSKALAIFPRTLEVFDMAANRVNALGIFSHEHEQGHIDFHPAGTPYSFVGMVPQDETERLLLEQLRGRGGAVEYQTTFLSLQQDETGVRAVVQRGADQETIEASYLVGCDGAHSAVRHALGLGFEGGDYADTYLLADAITNDALPANELHLCANRQGPLALFPMSATRWRIIATTTATAGDEPSLDSVNAIIAERGPKGITAQSLLWSGYFRIHHRCVSQMSSGRVFIAGDAAHIHSPFGGQGMNTGLQDAWNLVWKLDLAVRGLATDALLASYTLERHPIAVDVIKTTDFLTSALGSHTALSSGIRDALIPIFTHVPALTEAFAERLSGLANAYKGSPIVDGGGRRYFDESVAGGKDAARGFILMAPAGDDALAQANELASKFSGTLEVRSSPAGALRLIRPDGYLAHENTVTPSGLPLVEQVLRRQVRSGNAGG
jgi:2-polyprenyl-6-methoxyphenol hydroxylase-like FAD-dependent oxidoreductase